jgi:hypothetical protein
MVRKLPSTEICMYNAKFERLPKVTLGIDTSAARGRKVSGHFLRNWMLPVVLLTRRPLRLRGALGKR